MAHEGSAAYWTSDPSITLKRTFPHDLMRLFRRSATLVLVTLLAANQLPAQERSAATSEVFRRFADHVVKIQVIETGSGAKSSIGSGFFVTPAGHVVTNYHVISSLINSPKRYRAELMDSSGAVRPVTVLGIDVVHDLAILGSRLSGRPYFALGMATIAQGDRLFSLGHPRDLGLSIVEGTYNGLLLHTLYPRIHLTGSLNPGMSGGPTIDEEGRVIGVNIGECCRKFQANDGTGFNGCRRRFQFKTFEIRPVAEMSCRNADRVITLIQHKAANGLPGTRRILVRNVQKFRQRGCCILVAVCKNKGDRFMELFTMRS